jgi:hypothetical protein
MSLFSRLRSALSHFLPWSWSWWRRGRSSVGPLPEQQDSNSVILDIDMPEPDPVFQWDAWAQIRRNTGNSNGNPPAFSSEEHQIQRRPLGKAHLIGDQATSGSGPEPVKDTYPRKKSKDQDVSTRVTHWLHYLQPYPGDNDNSSSWETLSTCSCSSSASSSIYETLSDG